MSTDTTPTPAPAVLASDGERERVAHRLREAAAEGRLTLAESDERQASAYAARTRDELVPLVADLPGTRQSRPRRGPMTPRARRIFTVHAAVTAVVVVALVIAWAFSSAPFFFPAFPTFWLALALFVHSRRAEREPAPDELIPANLR
ncbi:MAG: DUF1707 domain-containing protein [Actinomycetota bacterium]|nr:DUF1707 domain-containing protein [Actinomycetota bacterium]